ncbi:MAG: hypothetical protein Q4D71_14915 [Oscillospiraceae bacterium]|nr:hypothetical protein [Oscillospiraceae bacterium]
MIYNKNEKGRCQPDLSGGANLFQTLQGDMIADAAGERKEKQV